MKDDKIRSQWNMNARDTGINIKSAQMKTHMNVSTLLRQRNSNKCSCTKKTPPIMKGGNAQ